MTLLALLLILMWQSLHLVQQDLAFTRLETEVSFWGQANYTPSDKRKKSTEFELKELVSGSPGHPVYLSLQASAMSWEAYWSDSEEDRQGYLAQTLEVQKLALISRPAHRHSWAKMLEYASGNPHGAGMAEVAAERMAVLSPGGSI